jgi:hypothetical protein
MTSLDDLCIHKDLQKTREYIANLLGTSYDGQSPIAYCKICTGKSDGCFYYYRLSAIKRKEDQAS